MGCLDGWFGDDFSMGNGLFMVSLWLVHGLSRWCIMSSVVMTMFRLMTDEGSLADGG